MLEKDISGTDLLNVRPKGKYKLCQQMEKN
jgi:hypothetical protein